MTSDDWGTPTWVLEMFKGYFDSCPLTSDGIRSTDGLAIDWAPKTFVNPPYSDPGPWVDKAIRERDKGRFVVLLVRLDTSTEWWLRLVEAGARFIYFYHRLTFLRLDRTPRPARFASVLVVLAP